MMGNNLQAFNTDSAKSITKKLAANKQHLTETNDSQIEVNLPKNRANSESSRSDYGVTSRRQLSSAYRSGYLKEASNGLPVVNMNSKHLSSSCHVNDTSKSSFVYYGQAPQKSQPIEAAREVGKRNTVPNQSTYNECNKKCPVVVDLTIDDSDDEDEGGGGGAIVEEPASTLPKILAAYSLDSKHPSYPNSQVCNIFNQRAKENVVRQNNKVISSLSSTITNCPNTGTSIVTEITPAKNGVVNLTKCDVISNEEITANLKMEVMNDVTNLRNGDLGTTRKPEYTQMVFANWSVRNDSNVGSGREVSTDDALPMDTGDQVIITKVVTSTEKSLGRRYHPRKAPIEVRELYFDEKSKGKYVTSTTLERDALGENGKNSFGKTNYVEGSEECGLEETASVNGNVHGTPWSFTMNTDESIDHAYNSYRDNKIRNLKDRIAKQQEAVEKLRTVEKGTRSSCKSMDRVLVVQIPDLKKKLGIQSEKKQYFRVIDQKDFVQTNNNRKRKTMPRKVSREPHGQMDDDSKESYLPSKRTRARIEKETIKQRLPRRPRGRSSPVVGKANLIPVVTKDLWHKEMEKVEADLALSNRPIDQTSFLLFLGLRKVQTS